MYVTVSFALLVASPRRQEGIIWAKNPSKPATRLTLASVQYGIVVSWLDAMLEWRECTRGLSKTDQTKRPPSTFLKSKRFTLKP